MTKRRTAMTKWRLSKTHCKDYCGNPECRYYWVEPGNFSQGTGFTKEEAELIVRAVNYYFAREVEP